MPRLVLTLAILVAVLTGCAGDDSHRPDAAWALSVCKRSLKQAAPMSKWTTGPGGFRLVGARAVTQAEAKDLKGGSVPSVGGQTPTYGASCKVQFLHPRLMGIRKGAGPALLAFDGGFATWVVDPHWAK